MTTTHNSFVNVSLPLDSPPVEAFQWSRIALFRDSGGEVGFLGGARSKVYTAQTAAATTGTELDAVTKAQIAKLFAQSPRPADVMVVAFDSTASPTPETPALAYDALVALGKQDDFYAAHLVYNPAGGTPPLTYVSDLADKLLAREYGVVMVDYPDTDIYDAALSASALNGLETYPNVIVTFCDTTSTDAHGLDALARWLSFNPDTNTTPLIQPLQATVALTAPPDPVERNQLLDNNANVVLPFGSVKAYYAPGSCIDGRQALQVLSRDWLKLSMEQDLRELLIAYATRGEIFPLTQQGLDIGEGTLKARLDLGVAQGKFVPGQYVISEAAFDVNTELMSFRVDATNTTAARGFTVTGQVTRNNVV